MFVFVFNTKRLEKHEKINKKPVSILLIGDNILQIGCFYTEYLVHETLNAGRQKIPPCKICLKNIKFYSGYLQ